VSVQLVQQCVFNWIQLIQEIRHKYKEYILKLTNYAIEGSNSGIHWRFNVNISCITKILINNQYFTSTY